MGSVRVCFIDHPRDQSRRRQIPFNRRRFLTANCVGILATWSSTCLILFYLNRWWQSVGSSMDLQIQIPYFRKLVWTTHLHMATSKCWGLWANTRKASSKWLVGYFVRWLHIYTGSWRSSKYSRLSTTLASSEVARTWLKASLKTLIITCKFLSCQNKRHAFTGDTSDGHPRIILSKALTSSYKVYNRHGFFIYH